MFCQCSVKVLSLICHCFVIVLSMSKICPRRAQNLHNICQGNTQDMPMNLRLFTQDLPPICTRYSQDVPKICPTLLTMLDIAKLPAVSKGLRCPDVPHMIPNGQTSDISSYILTTQTRGASINS